MKGIIVDAYSTGSRLAKTLSEMGVTIFHFRSKKEIPDMYKKSFNKSYFSSEYFVDQLREYDFLKIINELNPQFVVAGSEPGVIVADRIANFLGLPGNVFGLSECRRNKFQMLQRLMSLDIPTVPQLYVLNSAYPLPGSWFPVIVKPLDSAGSENVRICQSPRDAKRALDAIIDKVNCFGLQNHGALVQKKLKGIQYMVNSVSINGIHKITEIWREVRIHTHNGESIYDYEILLSKNDEDQEKIKSYVELILTSLGVCYGPAHTELFLTLDGPILLECASRLQGGIDGEAVLAATGSNHIRETIDCLLSPEIFLENIGFDLNLRKRLMLVNLISNKSGVIRRSHFSSTVSKLHSFHSAISVPGAGDIIKKTIDMISKPGIVYLLHDDIHQINSDYKSIREFESKGCIFDVEEV